MSELGVNIAVIDGGRVLLTQREDFEVWCLPGGEVDPNESVATGAVREVREETGLEVEVRSLAGVYYQADHPAGEFFHFVFHCAARDLTQLRADTSEVQEHRFCAADALPAPMSPAASIRILDALAHPSARLPVVLPARSGD